jgi:hypothetical protein
MINAALLRTRILFEPFGSGSSCVAQPSGFAVLFEVDRANECDPQRLPR